jgi:hypothetical protein
MAEIKEAHVISMEAVLEAAKATAVCANATRATDSNCSRICADTSDLCFFTASMMARGSHFMSLVLKAAAEALDNAARQCEAHQAWHCQKCQEACHTASREIRRLIGELPVEGVATGQMGHTHKD